MTNKEAQAICNAINGLKFTLSKCNARSVLAENLNFELSDEYEFYWQDLKNDMTNLLYRKHENQK